MILFLHGLIGSPEHWQSTAVALPGHETRSPQLQYLGQSLDDLEASVRTTLPAKTPLTIVGNSIGCVLALRLYDLADRLVLTAPPFAYENEPVTLRKSSLADYLDTLYCDRRTIESVDSHRRQALERLTELMSCRQNLREIRRLKRESLSFKTDPRLIKAAHKTVCVIGAADFTTPVPEFSAFLQNTAPQTTLEVIKDCAHAIPLEAPYELACIIEREHTEQNKARNPAVFSMH